MHGARLNPQDRSWDDDALTALFTQPSEIPTRFSMALMFDEGVNQKIIPTLLERCERLNITTVQKEGLTGEKSDYQVLAHARRIACTLVVDDVDYYWADRRLNELGLNHAGIIIANSNSELGLEQLI